MKKLLFIVILLCSYLDVFARAGGHGHGWGNTPSGDGELILMLPLLIIIFGFVWWDNHIESIGEKAEEEHRLRKLKKS